MRRILTVVLALAATLGAAWLILLRADIPLAELEDRYALDDSAFVTLANGDRIHITDTGPREAPVVVLIHGFSASLHTWNKWRAPLSQDYRVVSLDLPGHGLTSVSLDDTISMSDFIDTIDGVVNELELRPFTLVGSSMGGRTAWNYTLQRPENVAALVLVGASGWPVASEDTSLVFRLMDTPFAGAIMKNLDLTVFYRSGLKDSFVDTSNVTDDMVDRYVALSRAPGNRGILYDLQTRADQGPAASYEVLRAVNVPTLVLHGEQDNLVPVEGGRLFGEAIPGAVVITYPGVGHLPQEEIAEESLDDLLAFLRDTSEELGGEENTETGSEIEARP